MTFHQPVILLIDDQAFFRTYYKQILTERGYQVLTAAEGEEGLKAAARAQPDAILLDVEMPGLDGIEVLQRLKAPPAPRAIPVIVLTATQDRRLNDRAFRAGAAATAQKSLNPDCLLSLLQVVLTTERL